MRRCSPTLVQCLYPEVFSGLPLPLPAQSQQQGSCRRRGCALAALGRVCHAHSIQPVCSVPCQYMAAAGAQLLHPVTFLRVAGDLCWVHCSPAAALRGLSKPQSPPAASVLVQQTFCWDYRPEAVAACCLRKRWQDMSLPQSPEAALKQGRSAGACCAGTECGRGATHQGLATPLHKPGCLSRPLCDRRTCVRQHAHHAQEHFVTWPSVDALLTEPKACQAHRAT